MQKEAIINAYLWNPAVATPASEDEHNRERRGPDGMLIFHNSCRIISENVGMFLISYFNINTTCAVGM